MNKKYFYIIFSIIIAVSVITAGFFYWQEKSLADGKIIPGVKIAGVDVGGLSVGEALDILKKKETALLSNNVKIMYGQKYWTLPYNAMAKTNLQQVIKEAANIGRGKGVFENYLEIRSARQGKFTYAIKLLPDKKKISDCVYNIKKGLDSKPIEPKISVNDDNTINLIPPKNGVGLDKDATARVVLLAIQPNVNKSIAAVVYPVKPRFTKEDTKKWKVSGYVTTFSTGFNPLNHERTANVRIAAQAVDKVVIYPGEEFSFNKIVGPRSTEAGYKEAYVIQNNVFIPGLGGGVCQVSSTLYNNVLKSNLKVTQRRRHSLPVAYVSPGLDATVVYGALDLKFVNTYDFPIIIRSKMNSNNLFIGFLGDKTKIPQVSITTNIESVLTSSGTKTIYDASLPKGKQVIDEAKKGYKVTVYKRILASTGAQTMVVSKDTYPPTPKIIRIGTNTKTTWGAVYGQAR